MVYAGKSGALYHMSDNQLITERRKLPETCGHSDKYGTVCGAPMHQDDYEDYIALGRVIRFSCRHGHKRTWCITPKEA